MGSIFKKHPDFILLSLAILLIGVLAASYIWGIQTLITNFKKTTFDQHENKTETGFDLEGAKALDLKGLVQ